MGRVEGPIVKPISHETKERRSFFVFGLSRPLTLKTKIHPRNIMGMLSLNQSDHYRDDPRPTYDPQKRIAPTPSAARPTRTPTMKRGIRGVDADIKRKEKKVRTALVENVARKQNRKNKDEQKTPVKTCSVKFYRLRVWIWIICTHKKKERKKKQRPDTNEPFHDEGKHFLKDVCRRGQKHYR